MTPEERAQKIWDDMHDLSFPHNQDWVSIIAAAIREAVEAERAWQPIETAPKDGTRFLCYFAQMKGGFKYQVGWFARTMGTGKTHFFLYGAGEFMSAHIVATHWMPLPAPPKEEGKP